MSTGLRAEKIPSSHVASPKTPGMSSPVVSTTSMGPQAQIKRNQPTEKV